MRANLQTPMPRMPAERMHLCILHGSSQHCEPAAALLRWAASGALAAVPLRAPPPVLQRIGAVFRRSSLALDPPPACSAMPTC